MDVEKQREMIRLWNRMRQVEGPVAEEIRIQILECFAQHEPSGARMSDRREVLEPRAGSDGAGASHRRARQQRNALTASHLGEVDSAAVKIDGIDVRCMLHACCRVCAIIFKVRSSPA